jgi:hypothetical protein
VSKCAPGSDTVTWLTKDPDPYPTLPLPTLPRRVLFEDMSVTEPVTKIPPAVTKMAGIVTKIRGRPAKGDKPMTAAERAKRYRAKKCNNS